jgi:DMSO/TMAO reductase YedYZ molybdopterin-dependent catalytic subunit
METATREDVIVAYEKDGQPLTEQLRLVIPGMNGNLWIAQITSITVSTTESQSNDPMSLPLPTPTPTPKQFPTPPPKTQPENQTTTEPVNPQTNNQPAQQQASSSSGVPAEYGYPIAFAAIVAPIAAIGYASHKRRKNHKTNSTTRAYT